MASITLTKRIYGKLAGLVITYMLRGFRCHLLLLVSLEVCLV